MTYWSIRHVSSSSCSLVWKPTSFCQILRYLRCLVLWRPIGSGGAFLVQWVTTVVVELQWVQWWSWWNAAPNPRHTVLVHRSQSTRPGNAGLSLGKLIDTPSVWLLHQCLLQQVYDCALLHQVYYCFTMCGVECGCRYYLIFTWTHHPATARGQGLSSEVYPQPIAWSGHLSLVLRIELRPKLWLASVRHSQDTKSSLSKNLGGKPARL